jgi:hypothetical protein
MTEPVWIVRFEGPGYSLSEAHSTEDASYMAARAAQTLAEAGRPITAIRRIGGTTVLLQDVGGIAVLTRPHPGGEWVHHARSWWINDPRPDALTPLPSDF